MTNEAAERWRVAGEDLLRVWLSLHHPEKVRWLDQALAAERRATVERIRATWIAEDDLHCGCEPDHLVLMRILDAEAER